MEKSKREIDSLNKYSTKIRKLFRDIISMAKKRMISQNDNSNSLKQSMFMALSIFSILGCGPLLIVGARIFMVNGLNNIAFIEISSLMLLVIIAFLRPIKAEVRSLIILLILYSFSIILLITAGSLGAGLTCILAFMFLSGLILDRPKLVMFIVINLIVFIVLTYLLFNGNLDGYEIVAYKPAWYINMMVTQVSGIGLMFLVNILYDVIKISNNELSIANQLLETSKEKEKVYADIYRSAPLAIGLGLPSGEVIGGNKQFEILTGYRSDELDEFKWNNNTKNKEFIEKEKKLLSELSPENNVVKYENELITKSGKAIPIELKVKAIFKEDDSLDYYISFVQDISERKETENKLNKMNYDLERLVEERTKELQAASNSLRLATKAGGIGVWEWYAENNEVVWDSEMYYLYDLNEGDKKLGILSWLNNIHKDDRKKTYINLVESLKSSDEFSAEFRVIHKDGSIHHIKSLATIYRDSKHEPLHMVGVNWDVTEEKETSFKIKEESDRLQHLLDDSPISVVITTNAKVQYQNKSFADKFGLLMGSEIYDYYVNIKDRDKAIKLLEENDSLLDYRIQAFGKNGEKLEIIMNYLNISYKGKKSYLVWIVDITPIVKMEELLKETRHAAESVIEYSPLPLLVLDSKSMEVLKVNKAFLEYNEIEDVSGINAQGIVVDPEVTLNKIEKTYRKYGIVQNEEIQVRKIGSNELGWVMFSMYPVIYNGSRSNVITFMDISEKKKYEFKLSEAKNKAQKSAELAEAAANAKSQFLANMSHEIRTPINAIMGLNELMYNTDLSEKQIDYTNKISSSSKILLQIINDILDFSKIEAGKLNIEKTDFFIENVLSQIMDVMELKAYEKGIELLLEIDETVPKKIVSDPLRIKQVLFNLISNAIKFTEHGNVKVKVELYEELNDDIELRFSVKDTGIGVEEEQLNGLFKPFTQADASTTRKYGGTGLGLVISKNIVEMMGGEIGASSVLGEGSEFYFTIRVNKSETDGINVPNEKNKHKDLNQSLNNNILEDSLKGVKVLLVEDNKINQLVANEILKSKGCKVDLADDGEIALKKLKSKEEYDIILMDLQMPNMDGYEATKEIRKFNKDIPIIALSADAMPGTKETVLDIGMNDYITKPIDQKILKEKIVIAIKGERDEV